MAAGWLGARFPVIPGAGNPGMPGASWPAPFVWWLWIQSVCKEGVWRVVGAGSSSHALPLRAQTFTRIDWLGLEDGASAMPPCAADPLRHAPAAALPWQKVPGLCLPRAGRGAEVLKRFSAPALTLELLLCPTLCSS